MTYLAELASTTAALTGRADLDVEPAALLGALRHLDDDAVVEVAQGAAALIDCAERLKVVAAAVIEERSAVPGGGLAGKRGHRSPVTFIQTITGGTRGDASRTVKVGRSLLEGDPADPERTDAPECEPASEPPFVWHAQLRAAVLAGSLSTAQHEAIRSGLGTPIDDPDAPRVWAVAAQQLMAEATELPVEALRTRAEAVRDLLDPVGAEERFARRFQDRSFRTWTDARGTHSRIDYDDEMAAFMNSLFAAALRPRRGGPRFMTDAERAQAEELVNDGRSNEQLSYDLLVDILRAGTLATAEDVHGTKQPGVRMVTVLDTPSADAAAPPDAADETAAGAAAAPDAAAETAAGAANDGETTADSVPGDAPVATTSGRWVRRDPFGRLLATAHVEDGGLALPGSVLDKTLCDTGVIPVTFDRCGRPLDVGREQRLFTTKQRLALAIRDGGCRWPGCDRPPAYCEAHHANPWSEGGRTDVDDGILLCRFHHLLLHNQGWRIARGRDGMFLLHPPDGGPPLPMRSKSPLRWAWDEPPARPGWRSDPTPASGEGRADPTAARGESSTGHMSDGGEGRPEPRASGPPVATRVVPTSGLRGEGWTDHTRGGGGGRSEPRVSGPPVATNGYRTGGAGGR